MELTTIAETNGKRITEETLRTYLQHFEHKAFNVSHANCPQCRADNSRRFAGSRPFKYAHVHEYLSWIRPRLDALKTGQNGGNSVNALQWRRDFVRALHNRINSHVPNQRGRKHAPDYAQYHMAAYGNDWHYLNT